MNIVSASSTFVGGRTVNQDSLAEAWSPDGSVGVWVVADGLGGHRGGEVASKLACESLITHLSASNPPVLDQLGAGIEAAHQSILQKQQTSAELEEMRTTLVVLAIDGSQARWAHCGDSRLYGFRGTALGWHTLDDSVPQALVAMGEILPDAIRLHEDRNRLTRCLGSPGPFRCTVGPSLDLMPGDAFLLCSDGFWEYVLEPEMMVDLAKAASCDDWVSRMLKRLRQRAPPDQDNYTALAVWVEAD
jgi:serine/threonine protein phosphatase PrpC